MRNIHNIADLRSMARRRLPRGLFEYVDRGAEDEHALHNNRAALEQIRVRPRVLRNVVERRIDTTLLGHSIPMPVAISPTAVAGMLWYDGDVLAARAAAKAGIPFTVSTASVTPIERIVEKSGARIWFQLYVFGDRGHMRSLIDRAKSAGCEALVLTVDSAVIAKREYNQRNGFGIPIVYNLKTITDVLLHPRWALGVLGQYAVTSGLPRLVHHPESTSLGSSLWTNANTLDASIDWDDVKEIRSQWAGQFLIKGILDPEDAALAIEHGVDGIIVSNHGGRNLDSSIATIEALPDVLAAVGGRVPVLIDGGFTRGGDIVKAIAMGASAVMVGRAPLWGIAAAGETGVSRALEIVREEIDRVLGQVGCKSLADLNSSLLFQPTPGTRHE